MNIFRVLEDLQQYLLTGYETPMSFIYNAYRLLKAVWSDEVKNPEFRFTDTYGWQLSYRRQLIDLDDIKKMHDQELERYRGFVQWELFFGEEIPEDIFP